MAGPDDDRPAGLREPTPLPRPRPGVGVAVTVLLALAALAGLWAAFTGVGPAQLDAAVLHESVESRTDPLTAAAVVVTHLGSTAAMAVLAVVAGVRLWITGRRADAVLVIGAMAGAQLVFRGLKLLLDRPRPPESGRLVHAVSESLPSGHATTAVVVIGTLVVLAWPGRTPAVRAAMVAAAAVWVGAVGLTRIYLGVHWFSDVIAGWLVGGAWLAICVVAWSWWRARVTMAAPGARAG
ncbi:phosphatase PAP2 family protein [Pseudonocardia cypriaca]|uniref:Undecaprenyl-diphosphatase n=1 Tax=Pseudonocardia cypriaca TaxID=882449 RepID=A0A543GFF4_9PSEU|nr:phosphatase PAP2 family protein [Pseudonocardia cypriaca]TQM44793.1 undecaprenyl-diphosphatase [Pseudonocardia cypriaca]